MVLIVFLYKKQKKRGTLNIMRRKENKASVQSNSSVDKKDKIKKEEKRKEEKEKKRYLRLEERKNIR